MMPALLVALALAALVAAIIGWARWRRARYLASLPTSWTWDGEPRPTDEEIRAEIERCRAALPPLPRWGGRLIFTGAPFVVWSAGGWIYADAAVVDGEVPVIKTTSLRGLRHELAHVAGLSEDEARAFAAR